MTPIEPSGTPSAATEALRAEEQALLRRHPLGRSAIFLPTEKLALAARVSGLRRVVELYEGGYRQRHEPRLRELRERFASRERAFIIGNGPSLNHTDLSLLRDEVTFGVNGIFLKFPATEFRPTLYVVEDHLVAEDRAASINGLRGLTRLLPINLAYCLEESDETIFFDHRPRLRFPAEFDFSTNATACTYAGCTVTFTCLQLAYFLGFRQVILIGVDCSYVLPGDVEKHRSYAVATLDMKSDDPNHFDPDYFGKGFRWHDPQVDKMRDAYREARRVTEMTRAPIYNATIGGRLEVFARRDYASLFQPEHRFPRVLILDLTEVGSVTATGQLKAQFLRDWPAGKWMQLFAVDRFRLGVRTGGNRDSRAYGSRSYKSLLERCASFRPDVVYCRPVPDNRTLLEFTSRLCGDLGLPVVSHIMDDWPSRRPASGHAAHLRAQELLRRLFDRSHTRLAIGGAMAAEFGKRYGLEFRVLTGAVDPADWVRRTPVNPPERPPETGARFVIRYIGALADNMTFRSVMDVAEAVGRLHRDRDVALEIFTMRPWLEAARRAASRFPGVTVSLSDMSPERYREKLMASDCLLIAYNFDKDSIDYTRYSIANKLPECLASGRPLLAYGPMDVATMRYVESLGCCAIVDRRDAGALDAALVRLVESPETRARMGAEGRRLAFERHDAQKSREEFRTILSEAAGSFGWVPGSPIRLAVDEGILAQRRGGALRDTELCRMIDALVHGQRGEVWCDPGDHRARLVGAHLSRSGWTAGDRRDDDPAAGRFRRLLHLRSIEPLDGLRASVRVSEVIVFAGDRAQGKWAAAAVADTAQRLLARAFDVWVLEIRSRRDWLGRRRTWRRLVSAPCAVSDDGGEILLFAFAEPVHPHALREIVGRSGSTMPWSGLAGRFAAGVESIRRKASMALSRVTRFGR